MLKGEEGKAKKKIKPTKTNEKKKNTHLGTGRVWLGGFFGGGTALDNQLPGDADRVQAKVGLCLVVRQVTFTCSTGTYGYDGVKYERWVEYVTEQPVDA